MDQVTIGQAQSPAADAINFAPPELSLWGALWDPVFVVMLVVFLALMAMSYLHPSGRRFIKKQTDYLDHQQAVNEKALEQNKAMEDLIAKQYADTNARSDKALEQSAESLRLHSEALEQLKGMNEAIARLTALMEQERGGRPA